MENKSQKEGSDGTCLEWTTSKYWSKLCSACTWI